MSIDMIDLTNDNDILDESNKIVDKSRIKNLNNISCYMVSIIHILKLIPDFYNYLLKTKIKDENSVMFSLYKLINYAKKNTDRLIIPHSFKETINKKNNLWEQDEQQDSQEFYNWLISCIEEEHGDNIINCNIINNNIINDDDFILKIIGIDNIFKSERKDYSYLKELFIGYLISNIECNFCYSHSPSFEAFITIPISIPTKRNENSIFRLEECLDMFIKNETLSNSKILCEICGINNIINKKILFWKTPKILVFQIKRFITDENYQVNKIDNSVIYPITNLNIKKYIHPNSPYKHNCIYDLIGINIHISEQSVNSGHYISYVKNTNNKWYKFDDDKHLVKLKDYELQTKKAYLLFYIRRN